MLRSVARTPSHLSNPVVTVAHNFFHRLRVSVWRYYSYYYYIFSESCAAVSTFSAGIGLLTAPFFIAAVALGIAFLFFFLLLLLLLLFLIIFFLSSLFSFFLSYYFSYSVLIFLSLFFLFYCGWLYFSNYHFFMIFYF